MKKMHKSMLGCFRLPGYHSGPVWDGVDEKTGFRVLGCLMSGLGMFMIVWHI